MLSRIMTNELYWLESIATIVNIASDWAVLPHLWDQIKLLISDELFQKLRRQMWRKGRESPTVLRTESQQTVTPRSADVWPDTEMKTASHPVHTMVQAKGYRGPWAVLSSKMKDPCNRGFTNMKL